ncbi:MAG: hypothetical protein M1818_005453 [Claussenomyces sp. TS43310]|nr:MAG: hypothetical protein M1818_005453 [Claussenomyces sp. TS43310]
MLYTGLPLAIERDFGHVNIETEARSKLTKAVLAFKKNDLTESANLFLESWRILRSEYGRSLHQTNDLHLRAENRGITPTIREIQERKYLSLIALHDFASACSRNNEEYKDQSGDYNLDLHTRWHSWAYHTTTEALEVEEDNAPKTWSAGSNINQVFTLQDTLGRLLEKADNFKEAALISAILCSVQLGYASTLRENHRKGYDQIIQSLKWIHLMTYYQVERLKNLKFRKLRTEVRGEKNENDLDDEDDKLKKVVVKLTELESKKEILSEKEEQKLIALIEDFHITPYKGESFQEIRENNDDDSDEEEQIQQLPVKKEVQDLINLLDQFHVT